MKQVHRQEVEPGVEFVAPVTITAGFQLARNKFSVWYDSSATANFRYKIVGTGHEIGEGFTLIQSIVLPDDFHVFHLVRLTEGPE